MSDGNKPSYEELEHRLKEAEASLASLRDQAHRAVVSEELYRGIFENNRAVKLVVDPENGSIVEANAAACDFYGYSREELTRLAIWDLNILGEQEVRLRMARAVNGEQRSFDFQHRTSSGEIRNVKVHSAPVNIFGRDLLYSIIFDASDVEQPQGSPSDAAHQLNAVASSIPGAVYQFVRSADGSFDIAYMSGSAVGLFERPIEELRDPGRLFDDVHPADRDRLLASIEASAQSLEQWSCQFRLVGKSTGVKWVHGISNPERLDDGSVRWNGVLLDITAQKKAEQALDASEMRFRAFAENSRDLVYSAEPDGTVTYVSPNSAQILGEAPENIIGSSYEPFVHPDDRELVRDFVAAVLQSEESLSSRAFRALARGGEWRWYVTTGSPILDVSGKAAGFVGISHDVTERREAEQALKLSERRFRCIVENADDLLYALTAEGDFTYVSPNWRELLGHDPETAPGTNFAQYVHPEDVPICAEYLHHILETGERVKSVKYRVYNKQGEIRWHVSQGSRVGDADGDGLGSVYVGIARDVTESVDAYEALRASEQKYRSFVEHSTEGVYRIEFDEPVDLFLPEEDQIRIMNRTGVLAECNDAFAQMHGFNSNADVAGVRIADLVDVETPGQRQFERFVAEKYKLIQEESCEFKDDGSELWLSHTAVGIVENDCLVRIWGAQADITERKRTEKRLAESEMRVRSFLEAMAEGVCMHEMVYDESGRPIDYRITGVNAAYGRITGLSEEEAVGSLASELYGTGQPPYLDIYAHVSETGESTSFEIFSPAIQKHLRVSAVSPQRGQFATVFSDITESKRAEKALRESEARYRDLFENAPVGVFRTTSAGAILSINEAMAHVLGFDSPAECIAQCRDIGIQFYARPERRQEFLRLIQRQGFVERFLFELHSADDRSVWMEMNARISSTAEDGSFTIDGFAADITQRKAAEEALRESEIRHRTLIEHFPNGGLFLLDREYTCLKAGGAAFHQIGVNPEEVEGHHIESVFPEVWRKAQPYIEAAFDGFPSNFLVNFRGRTYASQALPIAENGDEIHQCMIVVQDITDAVEAQAENERMRLAIEQAGESIVITDASANMQYVNPTFERISGYKREEALGKNPRILKSGAHDDSYYAEMWETLASGKTWQGRLVNQRKDGKRFTEEATITPVRDGSGDTLHYVAVKRDITHELILEEQYRQAQKMEAIGQLTGGVAHDFNNLLQVINGHTEMAMHDLQPDHPMQEPLAQIAKAGERAASLVSKLLMFSRRQIMRPRVLDLNEVVGDLLRMLKRIIGEHIRLEWLPGKQLGAVHGDLGMIEHAILNLCVNARDAMPEGGVLTIETQNVLFDSEYCAAHAWAQPGRFVLLSITDTGCGMDNETAARVFDPFFTTKGEGKGTGLGLSTVYGAVRQHEGMVNVYSEVGQGSTFKIYLPQCERKANTVGTMINRSVGGGTETILVAEDDEPVRKLAEKVLERVGYTVLVARDGREAVEIFEERGGEIDLVLLDVVMPGMGGREAYECMRSMQPDLRALFVSGYSENAIHTNFVLDEHLSLVQKPYAPDTLLRAVRQTLA
jgi:PAS domain S-box-containing protein